ncbi:MAG: hypothetical protein LBJ68_00225 [Endomicrobium sp.]|jgi:hypothetical protein|nr:hypothetical protein [Endomicrobium sp.]
MRQQKNIEKVTKNLIRNVKLIDKAFKKSTKTRYEFAKARRKARDKVREVYKNLNMTDNKRGVVMKNFYTFLKDIHDNTIIKIDTNHKIKDLK